MSTIPTHPLRLLFSRLFVLQVPVQTPSSRVSSPTSPSSVWSPSTVGSFILIEPLSPSLYVTGWRPTTSPITEVWKVRTLLYFQGRLELTRQVYLVTYTFGPTSPSSSSPLVSHTHLYSRFRRHRPPDKFGELSTISLPVHGSPYRRPSLSTMV